MNEDIEMDICADFLSERKYEMLIYTILQKSKGEWTYVHEILSDGKYSASQLGYNIYACWVDPLQPDPGFSLVIFCSSDSMVLFSGIYNKDRLFREFSTLGK